jgi:DMSO reductase anchor subunit
MFNSTTRHRVAVKTMVTTLETLVLYSSWLTNVVGVCKMTNVYESHATVYEVHA